MADEHVLGAMIPFVQLRTQVAAALARQGLQLTYIAVIPGDSVHSAHHIQVIATLADSTSESTDVDLADQFDEVLRGARQAELSQKTQEMMDDLRRRLNGGGFL